MLHAENFTQSAKQLLCCKNVWAGNQNHRGEEDYGML